jgi:hypothetical protein
LPRDKAQALAETVAADPRKFKADALAWRLRLSMAERTSLKITTIGAFDLSKAEREAERKRRRCEAERARRAKNSSGRPRGRPRINAWPAEKALLLATDLCPTPHAAREPSQIKPDVDASTKENLIGAENAASSKSFVEDRPAVIPSPTARATSPPVSGKPPPGVIDEAVEMARRHPHYRLPTNRPTIQRMVERFWPGFTKSAVTIGIRYYGSFKPERDLRCWISGFRYRLDEEAAAIDRHTERRRKWKRDRKNLPCHREEPNRRSRI